MADAETERAALVKALTDELDLYREKEIETEAGTFLHVGRQLGEQRRWSTTVQEIYKSPSDLLFSTPWERGNTEGQENEFFPEQTFEVESYEVTVTKYREKKDPNG